MQILNYKVGSDPEVWLRSRTTQQMIPVIGLLGGTKDAPIEFAPGFAYQEDNCSAEFNIPPADTKKELIDFLNTGINELENVLSEYEIVVEGSAEFHPDWLKKPKAVIIGCSEDFNAYTKDLDNIPNLKETNVRCAGGHIHIGYEGSTWANQVLLVKYLDLYLNAPAILLDPDERRKSIYGNPGRFRPKDYGESKNHNLSKKS